MRNKQDDLFQTQEEFKSDEIEEYIKFHPSKAEIELGDTYHAISQELVNE